MNGPHVLDRAKQELAQPNLTTERRKQLEAIIAEHQIGPLTTPNPHPAHQ